MQKCLACHGAADPKGDYQLTTFELLLKPGASSSASVTPGKPDESELLRLIASDDKDERMPKDGDPLSAEQIATVKRWIEEGAKFDAADPKAPLASIVPRLPHPDPPESYRIPVPVTAPGFQSQWAGTGRQRLSRDHDLESHQRRSAAAHQERAATDARPGL